MDMFDYSAEELKADLEKQKEIFQAMLRALENDGKCRIVFHQLALALFDTNME